MARIGRRGLFGLPIGLVLYNASKGFSAYDRYADRRATNEAIAATATVYTAQTGKMHPHFVGETATAEARDEYATKFWRDETAEARMKRLGEFKTPTP